MKYTNDRVSCLLCLCHIYLVKHTNLVLVEKRWATLYVIDELAHDLVHLDLSESRSSHDRCKVLAFKLAMSNYNVDPRHPHLMDDTTVYREADAATKFNQDQR